MIYSLLDGEGGANNNWYIWILVAVVAVMLVGWLFLSGRKNKQSRKEYMEQLDAIGPGNKVKTAGGICGVVVEVCDDNTVIIETGSEQSGKSYIKMDKELIAQTDAKGPSQIAREEAEARRKAEKAEKAARKNGEWAEDEKTDPAPEKTEEAKPEEESAPAPAEAPQEEVTEEAPAEEAKPKKTSKK